MYKPIQVIAYERDQTYVFSSISDAALAYGVNKKIILDRIKDGCTLKDGYTTLDYYSPEEETIKALEDIRNLIKSK